jgi:acyl-CoA thioesterase
MSTTEHPFADLLGFEVEKRSDGTCTSCIEIQPHHHNPHGIVHGAVVYALADTGMGGALTAQLNEDEFCSTVEIKINYFRPAVSGRIRCETSVINRGSRTGVMESDVFDDQDRLIARAMGTFMISRHN